MAQVAASLVGDGPLLDGPRPSLVYRDQQSEQLVPVKDEERRNEDCNDGDVDESDDDEASIDTQDAFLDMLGLKKENDQDIDPLSSVLVMCMDEEGSENDLTSSSLLQLKMTPIALPPKCSRYSHPPSQCVAVVVDDFWPARDCQAMIDLARQTKGGFQYITEAAHTAPDGSTHKVKLQNPNPHKLAVLEHAATLNGLWNKLVATTNVLSSPSWLLPYLKRHNDNNDNNCKQQQPAGLNPRLRVLEYNAANQDRFEPHFDATTHVGPYTSRITVLLYLNTGQGVDFDGGETWFLNSHISSSGSGNTSSCTSKHNQTNDQTMEKITPQTGRLVMFEHDLYHAGAPLQWGTKYVLRTDILFPSTTLVNSEDVVEEDTTYQHDDTNTNTISDDNAPVANDTQEPTTVTIIITTTTTLVADLCRALDWSPDDVAILDDMGLLHVTLESFLVPGRRLLESLLKDAGISSLDNIQRLVQTAVEQVRKSKGYY